MPSVVGPEIRLGGNLICFPVSQVNFFRWRELKSIDKLDGVQWPDFPSGSAVYNEKQSFNLMKIFLKRFLTIKTSVRLRKDPIINTKRHKHTKYHVNDTRKLMNTIEKEKR